MSLHLALFLFLLLTLLPGCLLRERKPTTKAPENNLDFSAGPPTLIYQTRKDYRHLVPVVLSEDKREVVSYPHPSDLFFQGRLALPTHLQKGYLLDNRGLHPQVAFLRLTYEEYSQLPEAPPLQQLRELVLDDDPLTFLCDCGNRNQFQQVEAELNALIQHGGLAHCRRIK